MNPTKIDDFKNGVRPGRPYSRDNSPHSPSVSLAPGTGITGHGNRTRYVYAEGQCAHPDGPFHDCDYVNARNRLIPAATVEADRGGQGMREGKSWDHRYMEAMTKLWQGRATP